MKRLHGKLPLLYLIIHQLRCSAVTRLFSEYDAEPVMAYANS